MLGKHHLTLSGLTILPFLVIYLIQGGTIFTNFYIALFLAVMVGSLIPDSDCGGKPKLAYNFEIVYKLMIPIQWITIKFFKLSKIKTKLKLKYEVRDEHRGIMHSPIGVLISSLLLTIVFVIFVLIFNLASYLVILAIFFGLIIGQFLHLIQDSMTKSGINWSFPFGERIIRGSIRTWSKDNTPKIYVSVLLIIFMGLIFGIFLNYILVNFILYLGMILGYVLIWLMFLLVSKRKF